MRSMEFKNLFFYLARLSLAVTYGKSYYTERLHLVYSNLSKYK